MQKFIQKYLFSKIFAFLKKFKKYQINSININNKNNKQNKFL